MVIDGLPALDDHLDNVLAERVFAYSSWPGLFRPTRDGEILFPPTCYLNPQTNTASLAGQNPKDHRPPLTPVMACASHDDEMPTAPVKRLVYFAAYPYGYRSG